MPTINPISNLPERFGLFISSTAPNTYRLDAGGVTIADGIEITPGTIFIKTYALDTPAARDRVREIIRDKLSADAAIEAEKDRIAEEARRAAKAALDREIAGLLGIDL